MKQVIPKLISKDKKNRNIYFLIYYTIYRYNN